MKGKGIEPINKGGGKWLIRVSCGSNGAGRKIMPSRQIHIDPRKSENAQRAEARKATERFRIELEDQKISPQKAITLKAYVEQWMVTYCKRKGLAKGTISEYQNLLDTRIIPRLGKMKLRDIDPKTLNSFFAGLEKENLSGTYSLKFYTLLHLILKTAQREQLIMINPADNIIPPRKDTAERPVYSEDDVARLVEALEDAPAKWKAYGLLALDSQMRRGECIGLNWADIDMTKQTVSVKRSCAYSKGVGQYLKEPKTESGKRTIHIGNKTLDALKEWKREQNRIRLVCGPNWKDEDAVFTQDDGSRMFVQSPTKWFPLFQKKHGLPPLNLHGLRHTGASLLVSGSADIASISRRLGHSRISTTLDIYAHAYEEKDAGLSDAMSQFMYGKQTKNG